VTRSEQVCISYGAKCNLSLLLEYGFALTNNMEWCDERAPAEIAAAEANNTKNK
jgi:hypothetical protein